MELEQSQHQLYVLLVVRRRRVLPVSLLLSSFSLVNSPLRAVQRRQQQLPARGGRVRHVRTRGCVAVSVYAAGVRHDEALTIRLRLVRLTSHVYTRAGTESCDSMFFEDGAGALEQAVRLLVSVVSYLLPNWATIYVFYVLPRFQFSTALDLELDVVVGGGDDQDDADSAAYELLLNEQEQEHFIELVPRGQR